MKLEDRCAEVVGLVPEYSERGDICRIISRAAKGLVDTFHESRSVEAVKRSLARCYALDLAAQTQLLQRDYHRSPPLPFYFSDGRIFVPFKLRQARVAGDASYGYIELGMVAGIVPGGHGLCQLKLANQDALPIFSQISTARLALYFGMEIQRHHFQPQPDPDRELLEAFQILRRYFNSGDS